MGHIVFLGASIYILALTLRLVADKRGSSGSIRGSFGQGAGNFTENP